MSAESDFSIRQELRRKSLHLAMGIAPVGLLVLPPWWVTVIYAGTALALILDSLRLHWEAAGRLFHRHLGQFARAHEHTGYLGVTWFLISCTACVILFDERVAATALLFVVIGDAAAAIVGKGWGTPRWWGKSLEGALACFVSCAVVGVVLLESWPATLAGSAVAAVIELVPIPVDDNLRVPICSAAAMGAVYALV